jgi:hypothetical protein
MTPPMRAGFPDLDADFDREFIAPSNLGDGKCQPQRQAVQAIH